MIRIAALAAVATVSAVAWARQQRTLESTWASMEHSALAWVERAERLPSAMWSAPPRQSLAVAGGALSALRVEAHELERWSLPSGAVPTAIVESGRAVVVGTLNDGLFRTPEAPVASAVERGAIAVPGLARQPLEIDSRINGLAAALDGTLFIATSGGAFEVHPDGDTRKLASGVFSDAAVWNGAPWFVSRRGLSTLDSQGFRTLAAGQGLPLDGADSVADCGASLCVGAVNGLWLFDGTRVVHHSAASGALPSSWVTAAVFDGRDVWAGTFDGGLALLSNEGRRFTSEDGLADGRVNPHALALSRGLLVAGSPSGLVVLRGAAAGATRSALPEPNVTALAAASRGGLWVGYRGGVSRIELEVAP